MISPFQSLETMDWTCSSLTGEAEQAANVSYHIIGVASVELHSSISGLDLHGDHVAPTGMEGDYLSPSVVMAPAPVTLASSDADAQPDLGDAGDFSTGDARKLPAVGADKGLKGLEGREFLDHGKEPALL